MALAIARAPDRWRGALLLALMLPFWTGFLMRINAWIGMLRDDGWTQCAALTFLGFAPMRLLYTDTALYIGMVYTYLPFMVLPVYARLAKLDVTLLEAAADLGATPFRAFLRVASNAVVACQGIAARASLSSSIPLFLRRRIRHPRIVGRPRRAVDRPRDVGGVFRKSRLADGVVFGVAVADAAGGPAAVHKGRVPITQRACSETEMILRGGLPWQLTRPGQPIHKSGRRPIPPHLPCR